MASVRMTQEMRSDIRRNATNAYDLSNPEPTPSNEYIAAVKKAVMSSPEQKFLKSMREQGVKQNLHARQGKNILPFKNKDPITSVELRSRNSDARGMRDYDDQEIKFDVQLSEYWVTDEMNQRWGIPNVYIQDLAPEDAQEIGQYFRDFQAQWEAAREARHTYNSQISNLLDKVTTLKQLLEVWPAAESLVSSDKLAQMHVKVTRKQKAAAIKEEISFDPTVANQTVLTAKLLGG
ncbi:MAG: Nmad5 family putative nucleotide modification protein [Vibrio toranzoniae]